MRCRLKESPPKRFGPPYPLYVAAKQHILFGQATFVPPQQETFRSGDRIAQRMAIR